ncbi:prepilin peptidase [Amycolatopsis jejuensis]|uniref:prepilin peptidase n=1 Tax=Amycolatopsis jejuensis TaxID=330084 RepID=UPI0005242A81|nr:A24 family peptidase [Amycolatopsis jejuensis]
MVLTAVIAAGAVVPVLLAMMKKSGAPVPAAMGVTGAAVAVALAAARGDAGAWPWWWLPVPWLVSVVGIPLALADIRHRRLPDILTLPAYPAVAVVVTLAAFGGGGWRMAAGAALGCLLFGGTHLIVHHLTAGGLGAGDVKLAGSFGAVLGAVGGMAPAVAAVLAAVVSLVTMVTMWLTTRIRLLRRPPPEEPSSAEARPAEPSADLPRANPSPVEPPADLPTADPQPAAPRPGIRSATPEPPAQPSPTELPPADPTPTPKQSRAGPPRIRIPYGPGLVLATWACAVFPGVGSGIT